MKIPKHIMDNTDLSITDKMVFGLRHGIGRDLSIGEICHLLKISKRTASRAKTNINRYAKNGVMGSEPEHEHAKNGVGDAWVKANEFLDEITTPELYARRKNAMKKLQERTDVFTQEQISFLMEKAQSIVGKYEPK